MWSQTKLSRALWLTNDKASFVAKEDSICLLSVAKESTLNEQWIKPCVPLWTLCFDWRTKINFLCIATMEKKKSGDESIFHPFSFMILPLSFREALHRSTTQFPQSKQRVPKLRFLQKLGCQKPFWDRARLCLAW